MDLDEVEMERLLRTIEPLPLANIFLVTRKAMCFSHSVDVVTALLQYGIRVKESTLCTSTWVAKLDVQQLNLYEFFRFL